MWWHVLHSMSTAAAFPWRENLSDDLAVLLGASRRPARWKLVATFEVPDPAPRARGPFVPSVTPPRKYSVALGCECTVYDWLREFLAASDVDVSEGDVPRLYPLISDALGYDRAVDREIRKSTIARARKARRKK